MADITPTVTQRFFNKAYDVIKFNSVTASAAAVVAAFVAPTHSHYVAKNLFLEAAGKPGLSKTAKAELLAIATAVTSPKYLQLCYGPDPKKNSEGIGAEIHKEFGHNVEAQLAINWALKQKPYWRLWRKKLEASMKPFYPEIKEEDW